MANCSKLTSFSRAVAQIRCLFRVLRDQPLNLRLSCCSARRPCSCSVARGVFGADRISGNLALTPGAGPKGGCHDRAKVTLSPVPSVLALPARASLIERLHLLLAQSPIEDFQFVHTSLEISPAPESPGLANTDFQRGCGVE